MRKLISLMHTSLDGMIAGPNGELDWLHFSDQVFAYVDTFIDQADTGIYGPKTFGMMEAHWPGVLNDPTASGHQLNHAKWYAKATKLVFSKHLDQLPTQTARLVKEDPAVEINALKQQSGKDMVLLGSPGLVRSLAQLGLIDEFVLNVNPIVLGSGIPLFQGIDSRIPLRLLNASTFDSGVVALHYAR
jgi:dihydrofolate reductase